MSQVKGQGKAISSGNYIGQESRREGKVVDNVRYISKCPFGAYYCCDTVGSKGNRVLAREKMNTIQHWKREVMNIGVGYPNLRNMVASTLEQILFAEMELSFYEPTDIICTQVSPKGESQTLDRKMKSRVSSLSQKVSEMLKSKSNVYAKGQYM